MRGVAQERWLLQRGQTGAALLTGLLELWQARAAFEEYNRQRDTLVNVRSCFEAFAMAAPRTPLARLCALLGLS